MTSDAKVISERPVVTTAYDNILAFLGLMRQLHERGSNSRPPDHRADSSILIQNVRTHAGTVRDSCMQFHTVVPNFLRTIHLPAAVENALKGETRFFPWRFRFLKVALWGPPYLYYDCSRDQGVPSTASLLPGLSSCY